MYALESRSLYDQQQERRKFPNVSGSLSHSVRSADRELRVWGRLFITHMHGDHCFGIPGVLRAIDAARMACGAAGPSDPVHIYGPPGARSLSRSSRSCLLTLHSKVSRQQGSQYIRLVTVCQASSGRCCASYQSFTRSVADVRLEDTTMLSLPHGAARHKASVALQVYRRGWRPGSPPRAPRWPRRRL